MIVNELLEKKVLKFGRASDLFWINFGKPIKEKNIYGIDIEKGEYSIHVQCPWRIKCLKSNRIILASYDIYEPSSKVLYANNFEWDIEGNNLFDEKIKKIFERDEVLVVKYIDLSDNNDLKFTLSDKYIFECFINTSTEEECWRFFKNGSKKHLVITGVGSEFE